MHTHVIACTPGDRTQTHMTTALSLSLSLSCRHKQRTQPAPGAGVRHRRRLGYVRQQAASSCGGTGGQKKNRTAHALHRRQYNEAHGARASRCRDLGRGGA